MQKILINFSLKDIKIHNYYVESFEDLFKKFSLKTFIFTEKINIEDIKRKNELEKKGIYLFEYNNKKELLKEINKIKKIIFVNTFSENLIILTNKIKKELGQKITNNPELFRNKKIQRELLLKYNKNITVNFLEEELGNLKFEELKEEFSLPFILKPKEGYESSGVAKIKNKEDFEDYKKNNDLELEILVEEFIDGEMFSIDYFVDVNGNITKNKIVKVDLANKIGINDFFNLNREISKKINSEIDYKKLNDFIEKNIKATGIKNTFVHHEFKLTSKGELKTIELNGRIGGYRLEMYKEAYNYNLFDGIFGISNTNNIKYNISSIAIYPEKRGILKSYNYELLEQIKKLKSFYSLRILPERYEQKEIGLTKDGFGKVGTIKLKNSNYKEFKKDYEFIEKNYRNLLIVK